jgi:hypothetical protein
MDILPKKLKELCSPALIYFLISIISLIILFIQNIYNVHSYHIGNYSCRVPNTMLIFFFKLIYILFWTWILNLICKDGHSGISWLLVLFPFILLFVILGLILLNQ